MNLLYMGVIYDQLTHPVSLPIWGTYVALQTFVFKHIYLSTCKYQCTLLSCYILYIHILDWV